MSAVFISYRRVSALVHARAVYERLSRELGPGQVFIDLDDMEVGVDFVEQIDDQLRGCRVLLALIEPDWASAVDHKGQRRLDGANDFVRIEIATALRRGIRVVPILIGEAEMPSADALPADLKPLARRHALALDFRRFDAEITRLVSVIQRILANPAQDLKAAAEAAAQPAEAPAAAPPVGAAAQAETAVRPSRAAAPANTAPTGADEAAAARQRQSADTNPKTPQPTSPKPVETPPQPAAGTPAPAPKPHPAAEPAATAAPSAAAATTGSSAAKRIPWPLAAGGAAGIAVIGFLALRPAGAPQPPAVEPAAAAAQAQPATRQQDRPAGQVFRDCPDCPEMVVVPAGSFLMGSPADEPERRDDEGPQRRMTLRSFALGRTEVTQAQWKALMGKNPSHFQTCGDTCPVEQVSWNDAQEYVKRLSAKTGKTYTLPSEAQWEFAARAGTTKPFNTGANIDTEQANFNGNFPYNGAAKGRYRQTTVKVASFGANAFGLYDLHGNVWEWDQDCYDKDAYSGKAPPDGSSYEVQGCASHVLRGGSGIDDARSLRAANRFHLAPGYRGYYVGFRVCRVSPIE